MASRARTYQRTETGRRAWESRHSGLPAAYRRILGVVEDVASADEIVAALPEYGAHELCEWLDELETLCFLEALPPFDAARSAPGWSHAA
jgi:hypothetical protein